MKTGIKHILCLMVLAGFLAFNFFVVGKYSAYPWWHESRNDIDPTNAATTVGLLNNSDLQYISHPGATIYFLNGITYRLLSLADPGHKKLFRLSATGSFKKAYELLEIATRTSRVLTMVITLVFAGVFYGVLYELTASVLLSFFFTFYCLTTDAYLMHTYMVRPEILSLLFVFLAGWLCLKAFKQQGRLFRQWVVLLGMVGFLTGFSVFSKIQIGPVVVIFIGMLFYTFWRRQKCQPDFVPVTSSNTRFCLALALANFILMPWWALKRPSFMTPEYIVNLKNTAHELLAYGPHPPPNFYPLAFLALLFIFVVTVLAFVLIRKGSMGKLTGSFFPAVLSMNAMMTGIIISAYVILLPASGSLARYFENTQHLVYSVFTNILNGRIMQYKVVNLETIPKIIKMHASVSPFLTLNPLLFVSVVLIASIIRLARKGTANKAKYAAVLGMLAMGFIMDFCSTLRGPKLYDYYACYSIVFYTAGLAFWVVNEWQQKVILIKNINLNLTLRRGVMILLCLHAVYMTQDLLRRPRATGESDQTPFQEYINTRSLAKPFWAIVEQSVPRKNGP